MDYFEKAYTSACKFYNVEILTDDFSIKGLKEYGYNCRSVTNEKFLYHDDFKIFLLENYKNLNIIVDPDIVFFEKVDFPVGNDLIIERVSKSLTKNHTIPMINEFIDNTEEIYESFGYNNVKISYDIELFNENNTADIYFIFNEGEITKINNVILNW